VRFAAVDIGTNSARLLIAEERDGALQEVARVMRFTRLGQGVDVSGLLAEDAIHRTLQVLAEYRELIRETAVTRVRATATSAARDAANSEVFFDAAERALGVRPELLRGAEEARLSFAGATSGLGRARAPFFVFDVGGGSTELVLGESAPDVEMSLQLGCVRMTERHFRADPPSDAEVRACLSDVQRELNKAPHLDVSAARTVIGLAGTVTALSGLQLGLQRYDASRTHHSVLTAAQVEQLFERLRALTVEQRRAVLPEPERATSILGGAAVVLGITRHFGVSEILVSEHDILDGLVASLARPPRFGS